MSLRDEMFQKHEDIRKTALATITQLCEYMADHCTEISFDANIKVASAVGLFIQVIEECDIEDDISEADLSKSLAKLIGSAMGFVSVLKKIHTENPDIAFPGSDALDTTPLMFGV